MSSSFPCILFYDSSHFDDVLRAMNVGRGGVEHTLKTLAGRGLVRQVSPDLWALTESGLAEAKRKLGQNQVTQSKYDKPQVEVSA